MSHVRLSPRAERWLLKWIADLAAVNPMAASDILKRFERLKDRLSLFPEMTERGILPGTRRIVMSPLVLTARMRGDILEIAAIRRERQQDARAPFDVTNETSDHED